MMRRFMLSYPLSKRLAWLCLLLLVVIGMTLHSLWQQLLVRQQQVAQIEHQKQSFMLQQARVRQLAQTLPLELIEQDERITGFRLRQSLPLTQWSEVLLDLQQQLWLGPTALRWRREGDTWQADMSWWLRPPQTLKPEWNLLPLPLDISLPATGVLVGTLRSTAPAALVKVADQETWLHEGTWHQALQATLIRVDQGSVLLQDQLGNYRTLSLQGDE